MFFKKTMIKKINKIETPEQVNAIIKENPSIFLYLSHESCNVCKQLKPKIINLLETSFPEIDFLYIDIKKYPEIGGQFTVFAVPTIITYFDSKEFMRYGRNLGIEQLRADIERPYGLLFDK